MDKKWPPDLSYHGPYPRYALARARKILVSSLSESENYALEKVKPKIGLDSRFGKAMKPSDLPGYPLAKYGFAESSSYYRPDYSGMAYRTPAQDVNSNADQDVSSNKTQPVFQKPSYESPQVKIQNFFPNEGNQSGSSESSPDWGVLSRSKGSRVSSSFSTSQLASPLLSGESSSLYMSPDGDFRDSFSATNFNNNRSAEPVVNATHIAVPLRSKSMSQLNPVKTDSQGSSKEQNAPLHYSGIFNRASTPVSATVSRPPDLYDNQIAGTSVQADHLDSSQHLRPLKRHLSEELVSSDDENEPAIKKIKENDEKHGATKLATPIIDLSTDENVNSSPTKISVRENDIDSQCSDDITEGSFQLYKCDFCESTDFSKTEMTKHLISSMHTSSSLYNARSIGSGIELISVAQMFAVTNRKESSSRGLVISCLFCKELFEDIFTCGLHSQYCHNLHSRSYCVSPVIDMQTVAINSIPRCVKCGLTFTSHKGLHIHWKAKKDHDPFPRQIGETFTVFTCLQCNKDFVDSFIEARMHVVTHASNDSQRNEAGSLEFRKMLKPTGSKKLPQFPIENKKSNNVKADLGVLITLQQRYEDKPLVKRKLRTIQRAVVSVLSKK